MKWLKHFWIYLVTPSRACEECTLIFKPKQSNERLCEKCQARKSEAKKYASSSLE
ncbi:hypothetical protein PPHE_a0784 [Pseudoalteromonas phenolica O-BC30]|nr:hypothetical protein [Pseudoalteromonas phenolica O-BC30]